MTTYDIVEILRRKLLQWTHVLFKFDREKNRWLIRERGLSFEIVIDSIEQGRLVDILEHPEKPHQRMMLVNINDYIWVVPTVWKDKFMKTAFPSRKMTNRYLRSNKNDGE